MAQVNTAAGGAVTRTQEGIRAQEIERETLSIMKACALVGVSRRTIYNWLASGKVEYIRTAGGAVRIFKDSLWRDPVGGRTHSVANLQRGGR